MKNCLAVAGIQARDAHDHATLRAQVRALAEETRVQWEVEAAVEAARASEEAEAAERKLAAARKFRARSRVHRAPASSSKLKPSQSEGDATYRVDECSDWDEDDDDNESLTLSDDEEEEFSTSAALSSLSYRQRMRLRGYKSRSFPATALPLLQTEASPMRNADDAAIAGLLHPMLRALLVPSFAVGTPWEEAVGKLPEAVGKCATCVPRSRPPPAVRMW